MVLCGLGVSNLPIIDMLLGENCEIIGCDAKPKSCFNPEILSELTKKNIKLEFNFSLDKYFDADIIIRTPGMNYFCEYCTNARKKNIVVTSEMEIFFELCPCKIIGVTGSDGKTTITTLIYEMLKTTNKKIHIGGNIGKPLLSRINKIGKDDIAVVELSSFQLMSMRKSPDVAVVTNISANHLDIHKNMEEYVNSKKNIILHQSAFSKSVLNLDNEEVRNWRNDVRGLNLYFSIKNKVNNGIFVENDEIIYSNNGICRKIMHVNKIKITGKHNLENFLAAICAVIDEISDKSIVKIAQNFIGIEHRIEFVKTIGGVSFYNDSIATSPNRTIMGTLSLFDNIILIAGGYDKNISFKELGEKIAEKVKVLLLFGGTSFKIRFAVENSLHFNPQKLKIIQVKNMEEAVEKAVENAAFGDNVVLSPACASFGLYNNFEEKGKHFKKIVQNIQN